MKKRKPYPENLDDVFNLRRKPRHRPPTFTPVNVYRCAACKRLLMMDREGQVLYEGIEDRGEGNGPVRSDLHQCKECKRQRRLPFGEQASVTVPSPFELAVDKRELSIREVAKRFGGFFG